MIKKQILPLQGKTIVCTRAQGQLGFSRTLFEELGATVLDLPALVIGPPSDWRPLDNALADLENFHWIIFSSANGVRAVEDRLLKENLSLSNTPENLKFAVVGKKTSQVLEELNVEVDFIPPEFVADSLINNFPVSCSGLRILLPRVESGGRNILVEAFSASGAEVVEVPAYQSSCPKEIPSQTKNALEKYCVNAITFTSGKTVSHSFQLLKNAFGSEFINIISQIKLVSIGPQTSLSCEKYFKRVDIEADIHDMDGLIRACLKILN